MSIHRTVCVDRTRRKRVNDIYANITGIFAARLARTRTTGCLHICVNTKRGTRSRPRFDVLPSGNAVPLPAHASLFSSESTRCHFFVRLLPSTVCFSLSRFCRGRRTRRAVRKSSKRHTQRKQTPRRAANATLSRSTDRFV